MVTLGGKTRQESIFNALNVLDANTDIVVTTTSCRIVSFETLTKEAEKNDFTVVEQGLTKIENHFDKIMYIIIKKH